MAISQIEFEDGSVFEVEHAESATDAEIRAAAQQAWVQSTQSNQQVQEYDPTEGMSRADKLLAGVGRGMTSVGRGVGQQLGLVDQETIDRAKTLDAALLNTGYGQAGNLVGQIAGTLPIGGAAGGVGRALTVAAPRVAAMLPAFGSVSGQAGLGALTGALQETATGESQLQNAAFGGLLGGGGAMLMGGAGALTREAQDLLNAGVRLTPGQRLGALGQSLEDTIATIPIVRSAIQSGKRIAIKDLNKAVAKRALEPLESLGGDFANIGKQLDDVDAGRDLMKFVTSKVHEAYDEVVPNVAIRVDDELMASLRSIQDDVVASVPEGDGEVFGRFLQRNLLSRVEDGMLSNKSFKAAESDLGAEAYNLFADRDAYRRTLASGYLKAQEAIREAIARQQPDVAPLLRDANRAFSLVANLQDAAARLGGEAGVFTPAQLLAAIRKADKSARKNLFAQGGRPMQDVAETAQSVLGNTLPDSGTTTRALGSGLALSALSGSPMAGALGIAGSAAGPVGMATIGASLPYTGFGMSALNSGLGLNRFVPYALSLPGLLNAE